MREPTYYIALLAFCFVGFIDLSYQYGTKSGVKSFSQSYSSSSASAHSSSYSSSGSYSFGDKGVLPIIGSVPIAKSTAVASASAGAASAVAGAGAVASAGQETNVVGYSTGVTGTGSYGADTNAQGSYSHFASHQSGSKDIHTPCCKTVNPDDLSGIPDQKIPSTGSLTGQSSGKKGYGQSLVGAYGASKPSTTIPSTGYGQTHYGAHGINAQPSSSGGTYASHTTAILPGSPPENKESDDSAVLKKPCCKPIPPGPVGSIYDYKVPSSVNTISQTTLGVSGQGQSGGYGGSKPSGTQNSFSSFGQSNIGGGSYGGPVGGTQNFPSANGQTGSSSYGEGNQPTTSKKPCCKGPFPGPNGSIYDSKPATAVGTAVKPTGSQESIKPSIPLHRPPINFPGPSGSIYTSKPAYSQSSQPSGPSKVPHAVVGYQPSVAISSNSILKPTGGYSTENGQYLHQGSASTTSSGSNSYQTGYQTSVPISPSVSSNTNLKPSGGYSTGNGQYVHQGSSSTTSSGSNSYQTGYQTSVPISPSVSSNTILKPSGEYAPTIPTFVVAPPATSRPIESGQYGSSQSSAGVNSYQTQTQGSAEYKPSCLGGTCTKEPPRTYLQPPQSKPVTEIVQEQIPQVLPSSGYDGIKPQTIKPGVSGFQVSSGNSGYNTGVIAPGVVRPETGHDTGYNVHKVPQVQPQQTTGFAGGYHGSSATAGSSSSSSGYFATGGVVGDQRTNNYGTGQKPSGPSVIVIDESQKKGAGGFSTGSSSTTSGYFATGGVAGQKEADGYGVVQKPNGPTITIINEGQKKVDGDKTLHVSGPGAPSYTVTENIILGGGLHEGPRGSPFIPLPGTETTDDDHSKDDSAIIFTDGRGNIDGYSGSRGFASASSTAHSGSVGGSNLIISGFAGHLSKSTGKRPTASYASTVYVDHNKPGSTGQGNSVSTEGTNGQGIVVVDTSSDKLNGGTSGSYSFAGGYSGSSSVPCSSNGCGTSHRPNGVPSANTGNVEIHITSVPSGSGGSYSSSGSYGGKVGGDSVYVDLDKPGTSGQGTFVSGSGTNGQGIVVVGTSSNKVIGGTSGSYGFAGGYGGGGSSSIPCTSNGCGTSYRQYSNAVPSSGTKNVAVHISSVPSSFGGSYSSGGSYGGKVGGGYGSYASSGSSKGSVGGSYGASSGGSGSGGFLSSIFVDNGAGASSGSYGKGGGYSHSSSFAKANSYASSSSFSSASSGSYSSGHY